MQPNWRTDSLADLGNEIWAGLVWASQHPGEPWRLPALATLGEAGPQVRTVVLREALPAARRLVAWTDTRSPKVGELRRDPRAQWLFHAPANGLQLRVATHVQIHQDDEVVRAAWTAVPVPNRVNYLGTQAPGTVLSQPDLNSPSNGGDMPVHFAVLVATVQQMDWLWLDPAGHRRAWFRWNGERWAGDWLVP
jgi:pyridoxamine 5'-phosphate oxidase